ncbi:MAG TPA: hypothetical protein VFO10_27035 [Oligoflexus sp.]|uniref:alpha/beta hydrolase family protein n=1 Tax=Oligoflexus sp. TaxID=1971216 RepID=UPI002D805546|nr:hypothetical protein [Oligoflexus sp.]HET9240950.1 hypothetical protein [Oligoflexus sp.]
MRSLVALLNVGLLVACGTQTSKTSKNEGPVPSQTADSTIPDEGEAAAPSMPEIPLQNGNTDPSDASALAATLPDPGRRGRFSVSSYTANLANRAYQSAVIYYPRDSSQQKFPATTLSGGYTNTKEYMGWLGSHLASHGIITIIFTPTNRYSFDPRIWASGHKGALAQLEMENQKTTSPIAGRVDTTSLGIMGFSMGGSGTALAVNELGTRVKAAVGLCAYNPAVLTQAVPVLHISGSSDTVAPPQLIQRSVSTSRVKVPKAFAKFSGMAHQDVVFGGSHHEEIARYATSWYKVFLANDAAYKTYLNGDELKKQLDGGRVFAQPQDYFYQE